MDRNFKSPFLFLAALVLAGLACTLGATSPAPPETEPAAAVDGPGTPIPAPENTPGEPADNAGDQAAQLLDLEALPYGADISPNFSEHFVMSWEGTGLDGQPLVQQWDFLTFWFTGQEAGYTSRIVVTENGSLQTASETVVFGGQSYFYDETSGCFIFPANEEHNTPADIFGSDLVLTGQASLVERGLQVNGVLADRYALTADNLGFSEGFHPAAGNLESGDLYLVQQVGYVTRLVLAGASEGRDFDYQGTARYVYTIDTVPLPDDAGPEPPEGCRDAAVGGLDFPRTDDAFDVITLPEGLFYKSRQPLADIVALYRQELPAQGWTPLEESLNDALATLTFEKDGSLLTFNAVQNEGEISVTLVVEP
jgi:hypothetical protein